MTIRPARLGDEDGWVEVSWARWQDTYAHHLPGDYFTDERRERWLAGWREVFESAARTGAEDLPVPTRRFVAEGPDSRILGIALAGPPATSGHPDVPPARDFELQILYIVEAAQGSGIAAALTEAVLPGAQPAQLWVSADNARAQAFYRKVGFEPDGVTGTYGGMIPEIRMVR